MYKTQAKNKSCNNFQVQQCNHQKLKLGLDSHPYFCIEGIMIHDLCIILPRISSSMIYLFETWTQKANML
jgi:hypothetical protein